MNPVPANSGVDRERLVAQKKNKRKSVENNEKRSMGVTAYRATVGVTIPLTSNPNGLILFRW